MIKVDSTTLDVDSGYVYLLSQDNAGVIDNSSGLQLGLNLAHSFSKTVSLSEKFGVNFASDKILTSSETALRIKVSDKVSLGFAFTIKNDSSPAAGVKPTDTLSSINVGYSL
ncbi:MAG TPA: DUF481 domain-containing protein [Candidatus Atribacteria bacterium]|nr:DUF481 domain-containing protein [Candidatus Atribacteria bacterium]